MQQAKKARITAKSGRATRADASGNVGIQSGKQQSAEKKKTEINCKNDADAKEVKCTSSSQAKTLLKLFRSIICSAVIQVSVPTTEVSTRTSHRSEETKFPIKLVLLQTNTGEDTLTGMPASTVINRPVDLRSKRSVAQFRKLNTGTVEIFVNMIE